MVYYIENYVTFYDDIFQLVHYVGNDVTAILVMNNQLPKIRVNSAAIRELECLPWATLAVSRLLRLKIQFPITGSVASGRIPIAPAFDIGHKFVNKFSRLLGTKMAASSKPLFFFSFFCLNVDPKYKTNILCLISSFWLKLWASVPPK